VKKEDGFTLVETLVSIALILIVLGALGGVTFAALRGVEHALKAGRAAYLLLRTDDQIRAAASQVVVPYWMPAERGTAMVRQLLEAKPETRRLLRGIEMRDRRCAGVTVRYELDGREYESNAGFAYKSIMEEMR
jgi:prepilin-type N-terminal cleavage/methylation domain-containing protein